MADESAPGDQSINVGKNQQTTLDQLLAELRTTPIAELLIAATELRLERPLNPARQAQFRQAMAAGQAITKILAYLHVLRGVDQSRIALGRQITGLLQIASDVGPDVTAAVTADVKATFLSGVQEVTFHHFVICVNAIAKLLPVAARSVGYKIPAGDRAVLNSYIPLRDYFEHLDERLIGKSRASESVRESANEHEWRVQAGFDVDDQGCIVINGKTIDVTSRGIASVEDVLQRSYNALREHALAEVHAYFTTYPDRLPNSDLPLYKPFVSVFTGPQTT